MVCTLVGRSAGTKEPFLASTSDDPYETRTQVVVRKPAQGYQYLATTIQSRGQPVPWDGMVTRGVNERGLAFTYAYVEPAEAPDATVSPAAFSMGLISGCADVEAALDYLHQGAPSGCTGNYLLLDTTDSLVALAVTDTGSIAVRMGLGARTNSWQEYGTRLASKGSVYSRSAAHRKARAEELLQSISSADNAEKLLTDHQGRQDGEQVYGRSICNHGTEAGTVSCEVLIPSRRSLRYTYGHPCGGGEEPSAWTSPREFSLLKPRDGELTDTDGRLTWAGAC